MSVGSSLKKLTELVEQAGDYDRPKARWVKLNAKQTVSISFLNEIDEESPEYNATAGTLLVVSEHSNPQNFRKKALCTKETEGECLGCENAKKYPKKGWAAKSRLYSNVLVEGDGNEEPYVAVLSQGIGDKSITPTLVSFANDAESITNIKFKLSRSGTGTATGYTLVPRIGTVGADVSGLELYDLNAACTISIPYAEQEEFYGEYRDEDDNGGVQERVVPVESGIEW